MDEHRDQRRRGGGCGGGIRLAGWLMVAKPLAAARRPRCVSECSSLGRCFTRPAGSTTSTRILFVLSGRIPAPSRQKKGGPVWTRPSHSRLSANALVHHGHDVRSAFALALGV